VTNYLNQRKSRHSLCDIGCGLGDILLSCDYQFKVGLDRNKKVINALKLRHMLSLSVGKLIVKQFRFATDHVEGEFDVIVMCNWIHKIESKVLKLHFEKLVNQNLKPQGELIFDTVKGRAYPFCHDVGFLTSNLNVTTRVLFKYSGNQLVGQAERRIVTVIKK
jgi:2-polyprenyl-3-methyl-5-hydroxy-6-metoxy-1,4-benzoquinol methylase